MKCEFCVKSCGTEWCSTKANEVEIPTIECDILDYITVNGRISKKLFDKVIRPKLERLDNLIIESEQLRQQKDRLQKQANCRYQHAFTFGGFVCNKCGWVQPRHET